MGSDIPSRPLRQWCDTGIVPKNLIGGQKSDRTFIEEARRRQIVDAAIDVLTDDGYPKATLETIARRVGISRGLISYHFEGRDDLMAAVVGRVYEDGAAYMAERLAQAPRQPAAVLNSYLQSNLEFIRDHRRELLALLAVRQGGSQGGLRRSLIGIAQTLEPLERILRWGQVKGDFGDFDAHAMAITIRNVIDGLPLYLRAEPDLDVDAFTAHALTLFARATQKEVE